MDSNQHTKGNVARHRVSAATAGEIASIHPHAFGLTKAAYSVRETLFVLSIGRTSLYKLVKLRKLTPIKLGKKTLFGSDDLAALLTKLRAGS
jgi:hypothetical protein